MRRSRDLLEDTPALGLFAPAALLVVLWLIWISASGGYYANLWYPSAIGAAALLVVTTVASRRVLPSQRSGRVALLAFAALVGFNYLSMLWADSPASALDAANELLLYLVVGWVFSILPWTPRAVMTLLGIWALGVTVFCAAGLIQATGASSLDRFFVQLRYATPMNYPNATAALAVMAMWPALIISSRRELPGVLRAGFLAAAVFLAQFSLLPQSRAAVVGLVLTAPLVLALAPDRLALLARMAVVGAGVAFSVPRTVAVDNAVNAGRHVAPVLNHAASGMLLSVLPALAIGGVLTLADARLSRRRTWSVPRPRPGRRGKIALGVAVLLALGGGGALAEPPVAHFVSTVYKRGSKDAKTGSIRLLSATPEERFDYARVAIRLFADAPLGGVGAGNFGRHYDALRRFPKHSQYTHDIALRALSETGIVGFALLLTIVAAITIGLARAVRRLESVGRAAAVAVLAVAAYFLIHGSLDWVDEFPALAAPALAFSLAAITMRAPSTEGRGGGSGAEDRLAGRTRWRPSSLRARRMLRVGVAGATVVLGAVLGLALVMPYLASRYVERAVASYRTGTTGAYDDLNRAAALNPFSADPYTSEGTIAVNLGQTSRARSAFEKSLRREDDSFPHVELALLDAQAGLLANGLQELSRAAALDADDPLISEARTMIVRRQPIDLVQFNQLLAQGPAADIFAPQNIKK